MQSRFWPTLLIAVANACSVPLAMAENPPKDGNFPEASFVQTMQTDRGVAFSILGPVPTAPAPTLFIFALDAERTLSDTLYRRCGNQLAKEGFLSVSVDLPCHGRERRGNEPDGLDGWRHRVDAGSNPMAELNDRLRSVLDHLIARKLTDPENVFACGTSRGGFAALHFAAADARVKGVAAYSPVTELSALREFEGQAESETRLALALSNHLDSLVSRSIWIMIGDRDQRVSTDAAIRFARKLSARAAEKSLPSKVELHVCPSDGHHAPKSAEELSARWIRDLYLGPGRQPGS